MERNFFCRDPLTQESWLAPSTGLQLVRAVFGGHFCQNRLCCKTTRSQSLHTLRHRGARSAMPLAQKTTHKVTLHYALHVVSVWKAEVGVLRLSWPESHVPLSPALPPLLRNLHLAVSQRDSGSGIQICVRYGGFLLGVGKLRCPGTLCP